MPVLLGVVRRFLGLFSLLQLKKRWRRAVSSVGPLGSVGVSQSSVLGGGGSSGLLLATALASASSATGGASQGFLQSLSTLLSTSSKKLSHAFGGPRRDSMILLLTMTVVVPVMTRLRVSPILGFLLTGMLLGPNGVSMVKELKTTEALAELGIVFFLFEMGLELSVQRLAQMRRDVFGLGLGQFSLSAISIFAAARLLGQSAAASVVIGGALALSSSAFVLQLLRDKEELGTRHGRASFGVLLFQDLAVVPLLVITPLLAAGGGSAMAFAMGLAGIKAALAFAVILLFGKYALNNVFDFVAKSQSQEAFLSVILVTVLGMSSLTEGLGLSNTLGAFMAGVLLSETKYRYQVEADIAPFRGLLLGLFFMTVGFEIDLKVVRSQFGAIMSALFGLLGLKALILAGVCMGFGLSVSNAQHVGLLLAQGGEFAFVAFGMAKSFGEPHRTLFIRGRS